MELKKLTAHILESYADNPKALAELLIEHLHEQDSIRTEAYEAIGYLAQDLLNAELLRIEKLYNSI